MLDPKRRFSSRVENYVRYRPGYPQAIITTLKAECRLTPRKIVADIGSGTGKLSELFLQNGNRVFGVEPNPEMRAAGERLLAEYPHFLSIDGSAENTTLSDRSVDFVTAGQAFHWFDLPRARVEFGRILKSHGWVALVWNERQTSFSPFMRAYEEILNTYTTDYQAVGMDRVDIGMLRSFFGGAGFKLKIFDYQQVFDFESLQGRLLSSSYVPEAGQTGHEPMLAALRQAFAQHQAGDHVTFDYTTKLYYGRLQ